MESKLIDRQELIRKHPALGRKKYTLDWMIRVRQIPVIRIGRNIYFNEAEIDKWIEEHKIQINNENEK